MQPHTCKWRKKVAFCFLSVIPFPYPERNALHSLHLSVLEPPCVMKNGKHGGTEGSMKGQGKSCGCFRSARWSMCAFLPRQAELAARGLPWDLSPRRQRGLSAGCVSDSFNLKYAVCQAAVILGQRSKPLVTGEGTAALSLEVFAALGLLLAAGSRQIYLLSSAH